MGCGCRGKKDMSEPQGNYDMKFIGKPGGKLLKGAPGNYIHGQIYKQPFKMSKFPFWQLVEPVPELKVPSASQMDSVYDDAVYVPDDEALVETFQSIVPEENINIDPNTGATVEPYMTYEVSSGKLKKYTESSMQAQSKWETLEVKIPDDVIESPVEEEPDEVLDRDKLKAMLDERGVKYLKNTRTATLAKMVEALESQE